MDIHYIVNMLKEEIVKSTGCTELGLVAYAAAKASSILGHKPTKIAILVSGYIYKNGINVVVPGTKLSGLDAAGIIGACVKAK